MTIEAMATPVVLSGKFVTADLRPARGTVEIRPELAHTAGTQLVVQSPVVVDLDRYGRVQVAVIPSNDSDWDTRPVTYEIKLRLWGAPTVTQTAVFIPSANTDISDLMN